MPEVVRDSIPSNVVLMMTGKPVENRDAPKSDQLQLAFDGERSAVFVVTNAIHGATFLRHLEEFKPRAILDLRLAPHFNFAPLPGSMMIEMIRQLGSKYIASPVPFHKVAENPLRLEARALADELAANVSFTAKNPGPLMLLVQHPGDAQMLAAYVVAALERSEGGRWSAVVVGS